jgi:hypothetical protein
MGRGEDSVIALYVHSHPPLAAPPPFFSSLLMRVDIIQVRRIRGLLHRDLGDEKTVVHEFFGDEVIFLRELIPSDGEKMGEELEEIRMEWG